MDHLQQLMDNILEQTDFETIHKVMVSLNWEYNSIKGIPNIDMLKGTAKYAMTQAATNGLGEYDGGGFFARKIELEDDDDGNMRWGIDLRFCLDAMSYFTDEL